MHNLKAFEILKFTKEMREVFLSDLERRLVSLAILHVRLSKIYRLPDVNTRPHTDDPQGLPVSTNPDVFLGLRSSPPTID